MRNLLLAMAWLFVCSLSFNTQISAQATNATCQNALMIGATNPGYPLPVGQPNAPAGNNYDCLLSQPNPLWFYFQLSTAGDIELLLSNTSYLDVDFILYGPFASANAALAGCGNLGNGGSGATVIDCSFSPDANEYVNVTAGNAGDFYLLLVTNYSNAPATGNTQIVLSNSTATLVNPYAVSPVWPGDADDNLIVDGDDWLQLGLVSGFTGSPRPHASINWVAQPAIDWGWNVGWTELKHADCNGDGQVDDSDTLAVVQNYSLTHVRGGGNFTVNSGATVQLIPQQNVYNVGDLVKIDVVLGQNSAALSDAYGYFFKIDVGNIFRTGSLQFTPTNSFLGTNASVWTLSKELSAANQIDIAQVRHNGVGTNGFGKVGEISFILSNSAGNTSPVLGFVNDKIINSSNTVIPVTTSAATFNVNPTSVQNSTNYNFAAKIVPNPVQNQAYLEFELAENSRETQIRIVNALGQVQYNQVLTQLNAGSHRIDLQTNLAAGTYFIEISNQRQTTRIPFVKVQ